ncbi:unnamed protein product, partial [Rotaria magnacalcarata]
KEPMIVNEKTLIPNQTGEKVDYNLKIYQKKAQLLDFHRL